MKLKLAFVGDMAFFGKYDCSKDPNALDYFRDVKEVLSSCDIRVGNLETPFYSGKKSIGSKSAYISSNPLNIKILNYLDIDAVSVSNNHTFDFGVSGLEETISILDNNNISWFGANKKDLEIKEHKILFHGYCSYNTNPIGIRGKYSKDGIEPLHYKPLLEKFNNYSDSGYFNVVSIHSGVEHVNTPSIEDITFARGLANIGNYFYYGHHPHVVQGIEYINNSLIAYSLGNFCFDDVIDIRTGDVLVKQNENNNSSVIVVLTINNSKIENYECIPIFQGVDKIIVGHDVAQNYLCAANEKLKLPLDKINKHRNECINNVVRKRNSTRNISWLIQRFRFSTLLRLFDRKLNKIKYVKYYSSKL